MAEFGVYEKAGKTREATSISDSVRLVFDGWREVEPRPEPDGVVAPVDFDPAAHNVDEVNAYLAGLDAQTTFGQDETSRVLSAEREGLKRKGVLDRDDS